MGDPKSSITDGGPQEPAQNIPNVQKIKKNTQEKYIATKTKSKSKSKTLKLYSRPYFINTNLQFIWANCK
jgi:hypothetical protein